MPKQNGQHIENCYHDTLQKPKRGEEECYAVYEGRVLFERIALQNPKQENVAYKSGFILFTCVYIFIPISILLINSYLIYMLCDWHNHFRTPIQPYKHIEWPPLYIRS